MGRSHLLTPKQRERRRGHAFLVLVPICVMLLVAFFAGVMPGEEASKRRQLQTDVNRDEYLIPPDLFTFQEKRNGAIIVHLLVMIYMFAALAIVCDEYFVASLEIICDVMAISDDVAGATFMAAGGSAPELATSLIGLFVFRSDVGFGTIVGSASFNVLFVIGLCAVLAGQVLELTWYPLFRDAAFYSVTLGFLSAFCFDARVDLWEAAVMLILYVIYIALMAFDPQIKARILGDRDGDFQKGARGARLKRKRPQGR